MTENKKTRVLFTSARWQACVTFYVVRATWSSVHRTKNY